MGWWDLQAAAENILTGQQNESETLFPFILSKEVKKEGERFEKEEEGREVNCPCLFLSPLPLALSLSFSFFFL